MEIRWRSEKGRTEKNDAPRNVQHVYPLLEMKNHVIKDWPINKCFCFPEVEEVEGADGSIGYLIVHNRIQ